MRLVSNRISAESEEFSALAFLETVLASAILFVIYLRKEYAWHIAVAVCLAPLLLLRTDRSSNRALEITDRMARYAYLQLYNSEGKILAMKYNKSKTYAIRIGIWWYRFHYILIYGLCLFNTPIVASFAKLYSIIYSLAGYPAETVSEIPRNWRRAVLCTDMGAAPEIIPHIEDIEGAADHAGLYPYTLHHLKLFVATRYRGVAPIKNTVEKALVILAYVTVMLPAFVYRFSVKSTAVVWFPLPWMRKPITDPTVIKPAMLRVLQLRIADIGRTVSFIIIASFAAKLFIFFAGVELTSRYATNHELGKIIDLIIVPDRIPLWHLASVVNAFLTWHLFFFCDRYVKEFEFSHNVDEHYVAAHYNAICMTMMILGLYTIVCTTYLAISISIDLHWPTMRFVLFPWS